MLCVVSGVRWWSTRRRPPTTGGWASSPPRSSTTCSSSSPVVCKRLIQDHAGTSLVSPFYYYYRQYFHAWFARWRHWLVIIARSVFWQLRDHGLVVWFILDYTCDLVYLLDMFVQLRTGTRHFTHTLTRGVATGWTGRPPHFFPRVFLGLSRCGAY